MRTDDVSEFPLTVLLPTGEFSARATVLDVVTKNASNAKVPNRLHRTGLTHSPINNFVSRFWALALVHIIDAAPGGPAFGIAFVTRFAVAPETWQGKAGRKVRRGFRGHCQADSMIMAVVTVDNESDSAQNESVLGATLE
jgi:hypothetical protein